MDIQQEYYQIFENGHPLTGMIFPDKSTAISNLKGVVEMVQRSALDLGWYRVEQRLPYLPIRLTLGFRKIYADGSVIDMTYSVRRVVIGAIYKSA